MFYLTSIAQKCEANNLVVENVSLTDQDTGNDTYDIEFDVSWENSWYIAGAPSVTANWDAAWVFAKFSTWDGSSWSDWAHATLLNTGSAAPAGSQISFGQTGAAYVGAFIYRSSAGTGSNDWDNAQLRWDYGTDGVADGATVKIQVFGIEMVYIPQGNFYVGDTDCDHNGNIEPSPGGSAACGTGTAATLISTAITTALCTDDNNYDNGIECTDDGDSTGTFCIDGDGGFDLSCDGIDNASFPTGYEAFYMMKYEISQGQYVDFLNSLTRTHQNNRTASQSANQYAMSNSANVDNRSGIRNPASIPGGAITFGCDLDGITADNTTAGDGTFNESDDGADVAANFLSWMDGAAYADWAGLRPFTELELTKAMRGGQVAVDDEYAWGSTTLEPAPTSLSNSGEANEVPDQGNMNYSSASPDGPFRVGSFADGSSTRTNAGAGYYGVLDLSGSLWERPVTIGNATGRAFTGSHGDGVLSANGFATNSDWPGYDGDDVTGATGSGFRGGSWDISSSHARVSDRSYGAFTVTSRVFNFGFRCARTFP
ncbi:MAG: SUMF1/EgtB/PvdO family nonheme iron enzyme [Candidatus Omnitrophica bacterium]|nr:SUMF1/EgtB/PvdO family nonheme iron enzyme [Candidatus Omnitrophota bacterium]